MRFLLLFCVIFHAALFGKKPQIDLDDFDALMGKGTSHWSHVKHNLDIATLEWAKALYHKNKNAQFSKAGPYKIPPIIHFVWLGPRSFPPESVENVRTWIAHHPGWTVKFWTDRDRQPPCQGMELIVVQNSSFARFGKCFEQSQNWGEKSDLLRYEILSQEGGVYVDHDANCLQPFDGMHRGYDFYCCLEPPHCAFVGRNVTCGNAVIGSRPGHPTIQHVMDLVSERWESLAEKYQGKDEYSRIEIVMQRTYIPFTQAILTNIEQEGDVDIILPAAYFFPKSGISPLYSNHLFKGDWDDSKVRKTQEDRNIEQALGKIRCKSRNLSLMILALILFNTALIGIRWVRNRRKRFYLRNNLR